MDVRIETMVNLFTGEPEKLDESFRNIYKAGYQTMWYQGHVQVLIQ